MKQKTEENNFKFAAVFIQIITFAIALFLIVISRYAFIFFSAAMLPTVIAVFFDRNSHKCSSATICTFNLIGAMPYLMRLWESPSINSMSKMIIADIDTWITIYGAAFIGQILYISMPLLIIRIYSAKARVQASALEKKYNKICEEWSIPTDEPPVN